MTFIDDVKPEVTDLEVKAAAVKEANRTLKGKGLSPKEETHAERLIYERLLAEKKANHGRG